jgi:hypothetical protein
MKFTLPLENLLFNTGTFTPIPNRLAVWSSIAVMLELASAPISMMVSCGAATLAPTAAGNSKSMAYIKNIVNVTVQQKKERTYTQTITGHHAPGTLHHKPSDLRFVQAHTSGNDSLLLSLAVLV